MTSTKLFYTLWDDWEKLDLGDSGARPAEFLGSKALLLEKPNSAVFLRDEIRFQAFRIQAEVAIPGEAGFVGFVFGARDAENYELVYLAPVEIQYDPVMNGSMTWQIYNGPAYQKALPDTTGAWQQLALEVQPNGAAVYFGDDPEPQLVISNLQHGGSAGKIGFWSFLPSCIRNLTVEEIEPSPIAGRNSDINALQSESFVTEWLVSQPYLPGEQPAASEHNWRKAIVEENGTLNLNRLFKAEPGIAVEAKSLFTIAEEQETVLTLGFSDHIRLWVNEQEVYRGDWKWNPPASDGRIRPNFASVPVKWKAGLNTVRAQVSQNESFGWGLAVRTGLSNVSYSQ